MVLKKYFINSSKPISEEVKKAREETDKYVNNLNYNYYKTNCGSMCHTVIDLKQLLAAERQAK